MDLLEIRELSIKTHIGVYPWEQKILQEVLIDLSIPQDFAGSNDQLDKVLDYEALCNKINSYLAAQSFALIETLAEQLAFYLKEEFALKALTISVSKPHAIKNASTVRVTLTR